MLQIIENENSIKYEIPKNKKVIVCGIPGAFTSGCTNRHLPGYVDNLDSFKSQGIDKIIFVAVNDAYVMDAWNKQYGHEDIDSVGDLKGEYTQSIAESIVSEDLGLHSKRHARLYDNGKLIKKFDEPWAEHVLLNL